MRVTMTREDALRLFAALALALTVAGARAAGPADRAGWSARWDRAHDAWGRVVPERAEAVSAEAERALAAGEDRGDPQLRGQILTANVRARMELADWAGATAALNAMAELTAQMAPAHTRAWRWDADHWIDSRRQAIGFAQGRRAEALRWALRSHGGGALLYGGRDLLICLLVFVAGLLGPLGGRDRRRPALIALALCVGIAATRLLTSALSPLLSWAVTGNPVLVDTSGWALDRVTLLAFALAAGPMILLGRRLMRLVPQPPDADPASDPAPPRSLWALGAMALAVGLIGHADGAQGLLQLATHAGIASVMQQSPLRLAQLLVWGPLLSEWVFRRAVFGSLRRRFDPTWSLLFAATIYAATPIDGAGWASTGWHGVLLCALYAWSGRLWPCVLAHALMNLSGAAI